MNLLHRRPLDTLPTVATAGLTALFLAGCGAAASATSSPPIAAAAPSATATPSATSAPTPDLAVTAAAAYLAAATTGNTAD